MVCVFILVLITLSGFSFVSGFRFGLRVFALLVFAFKCLFELDFVVLCAIVCGSISLL